LLCLAFNALAAPDIASVPPDLVIPPLSDGPPTPGKRVKQAHPTKEETEVYHTLYLPTDWAPQKRFPVIVEFAGNGPYQNDFGDVSTGLVEGSRLGYGLTEGKGYLWLCLPFLNEANTTNVTQWWGDKPTYNPAMTIDYCKKVVPWICQTYGGDPKRVILCGFSRGAIAVNHIGLHDDAIASLWCASIAYSHYDGVIESWGYPNGDRTSARTRLTRLAKRPQFILHEVSDRKSNNLAATRSYLEKTGVDLNTFRFLETGFRNHNDAWTLRPSPARKALRGWLTKLPSNKNAP
ncbi:MAG: hypothetical protein ACKVHP_25055, partial [Verrucomicrobiales bacterium]